MINVNEKYKTIAEWAWAYRKMGWNAVPLYNYTKIPSGVEIYDENFGWVPGWKTLESRMATEKEFIAWFGKGDDQPKKQPTGVGIITGKISGIVVIDEDSYKSDGMSFTTSTKFRSKTARGGHHYFFRYVEPIKTSGFRKGVNIEIKSDGGFLVLPPSEVDVEKVGRSKYLWESVCKLDEIPPITEKELSIYRSGDWNRVGGVRLEELTNVEKGNRHNALRTLAIKTFFRFRQEEWDIAEKFIRSEAGKYTPPHPKHDVDLIVRDARNYTLNNGGSKAATIPEIRKVGPPRSISAVSIERLAERELEKIAPSTGYPDLDKIIKGFIPGHLYMFTGDTNVGKCEGKDTAHLMFDGSIKLVQDIAVGDLLMGPDNKPRKVLSLARGVDEMFQINQRWGKPYVVNKNHVLSLKCSNLSRKVRLFKEYSASKIINIPLDEYLAKTKAFKKFVRGWHVPVQFKEKPLEVDPYVLGLWLGDGYTSSANFSTTDWEIAYYLKEYAPKINQCVKIRKDKTCFNISITSGVRGNHQSRTSLQKSLRLIGVLGDKHIPEKYRINSRENRLLLLAGIIDTDGYIQKSRGISTGKPCFSYEIMVMNKRLANDILLLACSLGFDSNVRTKKVSMKRKDGTVYRNEGYRIGIYGAVSEIPVILSHKKINHNKSKAVGFSSFSITPLGIGDYYGFTLDGDGLYLLSDCTVTHNTTMAMNFADRIVKQGKSVLYFALEPENTVVDYLASIRTNKMFDSLVPEDLSFNDPNLHVYGKDVIQNVEDMLSAVRDSEQRYDLIIVDHIGYFIKDKSNVNQDQANVIKQIVGLAKEKKSAILTIAHLKKPQERGKKRKMWIPTMDDISGSAAFKQDSTDVLILIRLPANDNPNDRTLSNEGRLYVDKTKSGPAGEVELYFSDRKAGIMTLDEVMGNPTIPKKDKLIMAGFPDRKKDDEETENNDRDW